MAEYYTIKRIESIIKNYNMNLRYTQAIAEEACQSVGVAQYGIEALMPKAGGNGSQVENQVIRSIKALNHVSNLLTDMKYLQDRTHRIDDEKDAIVLYSLMNGKKVHEIADLLDVSKPAVHRRIEKIAHLIKGV